MQIGVNHNQIGVKIDSKFIISEIRLTDMRNFFILFNLFGNPILPNLLIAFSLCWDKPLMTKLPNQHCLIFPSSFSITTSSPQCRL
jgi:hypothetical protein